MVLSIQESSKNTHWWHKEAEDVVCDLCPRNCRISEGNRGFCFVRSNIGGQMVLTTYGKSTGFCIDPVEKKPLNHFIPGTPTLSFGTAGCNLGCKFCQNWDISKSREIEVLSQTATPRAIVDAAKNNNCRSLAFTYNDPTTWAEYAIDTAALAREEGIKTIAVSAGYINPKAREALYAHMDAANIDLKAFTDVFYKRLTRSKIAPVLETLEWLKHESKVWFEITTLLIPGENDSEKEIDEMCHWILEKLGNDVPLHFTAFHPDFKMMSTPRTPHETLIRARKQAVDLGIQYVYVGNVLDRDNQSTYCPKCKKMVIERDHYELGIYEIYNGSCGFCKHPIVGVFEEQRGTWGRKRQNIDVNRGTSKNMQVLVSETRLDFSENQIKEIIDYTWGVIVAATLGQPVHIKLSQECEKAPAFGIFTTLKRGDILRACKGQFSGGPQTTLGELLRGAASSSATSDPRFPAIMPEELPFLHLDISLMHTPEMIKVKGLAVIQEVKVGKHGLRISHPQGSGLLLPQVPVENSWDTETFLKQLCRKANLSTDKWKDSQAEILRFQCAIFDRLPEQQELNERASLSLLGPALESAKALFNQGKENSSKELNHPFPGKWGVLLKDVKGHIAVRFSSNTSVEMLLKELVAQLKSMGASEPSQIVFMTQGIQLRPQDYPSRHQYNMQDVILGQHENKLTCIFPGDNTPLDKVSAALKSLEFNQQQWQEKRVQLTAFRMVQGAVEVIQRLPALAGKFYPARKEDICSQLETFFKPYAKKRKKTYRAIMLPHAGWQFCGEVIAETLAKVKLPKHLIVIGPKHTHFGAQWSVSKALEWSFPHTNLVIDHEKGRRLCELVSELAMDNEAHTTEHSIEVQMPFFHYRNPDVHVLPIVLGNGSYELLKLLAKGLYELMQTYEERPLLVISSDMNHFDTEVENRRKDYLALDAMQTGSPIELYRVCQENAISMCGLLPAVVVMETLLMDTPHIKPELVCYANSAKVSGNSSRVVGYAGVVIE